MEAWGAMLPILIDIVTSKDVAEKAALLMYIIAPAGYFPSDEYLMELSENGESPPSEETIDSIHFAFLRGLPQYFRTLNHSDSEVRRAAAECVTSSRLCRVNSRSVATLIGSWLEDRPLVPTNRLCAYFDTVILKVLFVVEGTTLIPRPHADLIALDSPQRAVLNSLCQLDAAWTVQHADDLRLSIASWDPLGPPLPVRDRLIELGLPETQEGLKEYLKAH
jgi:hypothetical protein